MNNAYGRKAPVVILIAILVGYMWITDKEPILNTANSGRNVVAFGDSLTAGYGAPSAESYPSVLGNLVSRPVINLGQSGETAVQAVARLPQVVASDPYMVIIEFGANDFMQSVPFADTIAAMEKMVRAVQQAGAIAVIVDTGAFPGFNPYSRAYKKMAKEKGALYVPGILNAILNKPQLKSDQVHPNADGYKLVAEKVHKVVASYL